MSGRPWPATPEPEVVSFESVQIDDMKCEEDERPLNMHAGWRAAEAATINRDFAQFTCHDHVMSKNTRTSFA